MSAAKYLQNAERQPHTNNNACQEEPQYGGDHEMNDRDILDHEFGNHEVSRDCRGETDQVGVVRGWLQCIRQGAKEEAEPLSCQQYTRGRTDDQ